MRTHTTAVGLFAVALLLGWTTSSQAVRQETRTLLPGETFEKGPWYFVNAKEGCREVSVPQILIIKPPGIGTAKLVTKKGAPYQCPNKQVTQVWLAYTAGLQPGNDAVEWVVRYTDPKDPKNPSPIPGDWHFRVQFVIAPGTPNAKTESTK